MLSEEQTRKRFLFHVLKPPLIYASEVGSLRISTSRLAWEAVAVGRIDKDLGMRVP